jgi:hypothetical protein
VRTRRDRFDTGDARAVVSSRPCAGAGLAVREGVSARHERMTGAGLVLLGGALAFDLVAASSYGAILTISASCALLGAAAFSFALRGQAGSTRAFFLSVGALACAVVFLDAGTRRARPPPPSPRLVLVPPTVNVAWRDKKTDASNRGKERARRARFRPIRGPAELRVLGAHAFSVALRTAEIDLCVLALGGHPRLLRRPLPPRPEDRLHHRAAGRRSRMRSTGGEETPHAATE